MINQRIGYETGWDAREHFVRELIWRVHLVLDSDEKNPKGWFENLSDFFDLASCILSEEKMEEYATTLNEIELLLYASEIKKNGKIHRFDEFERRKRKELAYKEMRKFFREINRYLLLEGIYLPLREKPNPSKAILNMEV